MLLVSETHFFDPPASRQAGRERASQGSKTSRGLKVFLTSLLIVVCIALGCLSLLA